MNVETFYLQYSKSSFFHLSGSKALCQFWTGDCDTSKLWTTTGDDRMVPLVRDNDCKHPDEREYCSKSYAI